jgi:hypothetical protein
MAITHTNRTNSALYDISATQWNALVDMFVGVGRVIRSETEPSPAYEGDLWFAPGDAPVWTTLCSDAFTSAFSGWTKEYVSSLVPAIVSSQLNFAGTTTYDSIYTFDAAGSSLGDCMVAADVPTMTHSVESAALSARLYARTGGTNGIVGYNVAIIHVTGDGWTVLLNDKTSGSDVQAGSTQTLAGKPTSFGIKVVGTGASTPLTAYVDGSPVTGLTAVSAPSHLNDTGKAGFYMGAASGNTDSAIDIDNFTVTAP